MKADRELTERAETRDHQGVLALVEPYRYADAYELAAAERPLLAVLDRVTDPRNLGRRLPQRRRGGRDGRRRPGARLGGRHPGGRPRVGRRGRALPIAVVTNLARYLEEVKGADLWVFGAAGDERSAADVGDRSLRRRRARVRRRGEGPAPARAAHVRRARLDPARRGSRVAERVASPPRCCCTRRVDDSAWLTLYLFDGYNLLHAGPSPTRASCVDTLASYVAVRGARGVVVFDGVGEDVERGPL